MPRPLYPVPCVRHTPTRNLIVPTVRNALTGTTPLPIDDLQTGLLKPRRLARLAPPQKRRAISKASSR